jgi:NAD(P)-dependent dehydrogenase (short-subunit alcohol dehydrogenase family)
LGQNAKSASQKKPHAGQGLGSRRPHRGQKAKPDELSEPQPEQVTISRQFYRYSRNMRPGALMAVDLKGAWLCSRAAAAALAEGAIVISWDHVLTGMGNPTGAIYAAAKGGILALSQCLAREFGPRAA